MYVSLLFFLYFWYISARVYHAPIQPYIKLAIFFFLYLQRWWFIITYYNFMYTMILSESFFFLYVFFLLNWFIGLSSSSLGPSQQKQQKRRKVVFIFVYKEMWQTNQRTFQIIFSFFPSNKINGYKFVLGTFISIRTESNYD